MRRFALLLAVLGTLLALCLPAGADVLWTPANDAFFARHMEECTHVGRGYRANGGEGFVTLWNQPDGHRVKAQFENGTALTVSWQWEDWACVTARADEKWVDGWVPMEELSLIYDYISFAQEYANRIQPYGGEFAAFDDGGATVNFYEYPGSGSIVRSNYMFEYDTMELLVGREGEASYIQSVFVDEQGLTWGFVGYMRGRLNAWFCLDDPSAAAGEDFPLRDVGTPELIPAGEPAVPLVSYLPYALVGAVAAVTAGVLALFHRKKKK